MSEHRLHIDLPYAEELLDLPPDTAIVSAEIIGSVLVLAVESDVEMDASDLRLSYQRVDGGTWYLSELHPMG